MLGKIATDATRVSISDLCGKVAYAAIEKWYSAAGCIIDMDEFHPDEVFGRDSHGFFDSLRV